ncbi:TM2 domain-containing protein [Erythrobacter sp. F6033]|uniref:TM2 domain-containing protein n=1 Tax=Erythrobacter sp. F6033 TaxID=2926401 RepID=UPI001FF52A42|nr:TM2 domain-containing protein [Erythrobacter sp. F6033]MCK0128984.1 TM2 domain-containing protein [Erythrobacter sp. F6033]
MNDSAHKQMVFEANRKSVGIAYLLWFFLGFFGVHRFYAGSTKTGIAQLVLALSVIGWLVLIPWLLADLVLIPGLIRDENMKTINMLSHGSPEAPVPAAPKVQTQADRKREAMLEDLRTTGYRKDRRDTSNLYR